MDTVEKMAKKHRIPYKTTIEELQTIFFMGDTAVIPYKNYVIFALTHREKSHENTAAVYQFGSTTYHECDSSLIMVWMNYRAYSDMGEAVKDAIKQADEDEASFDPFEIVMQYTEPDEVITTAQAEKLLSQIEADGYKVPHWFTPEEFISIHADLNWQEEDEEE